jgi:hypothetical protein
MMDLIAAIRDYAVFDDEIRARIDEYTLANRDNFEQ